MRKILFLLLSLSWACLTAYAQEHEEEGLLPLRLLHGNCMVTHDMSPRHAVTRATGAGHQWDASRTYRQMVVLMAFSDQDFREENTPETYHDLFNKNGYNQRIGLGCVADYFRYQSGNRFNLQFDIYGPVKVNAVAKSGDGTSKFFGEDLFAEAMQKLATELPDLDCSPYDWDGDGAIDQVVIVYAGYTGNIVGNAGYIWPNTWSMPEVTMPDGIKARYYTASAELFTGKVSCGIGTICHEFSHCLGLPDVYPVTKSTTGTLSVVDEWDLMDGGTISNYGWCPPNYSPLEKMLLGWLDPVELARDTVITGMKPISDGGEVFLVRHSDNEYYLLENRSWQGWDAALPGEGLLVWHVYYDSYSWQANIINNDEEMLRYHLVTADNLDYNEWLDLYDSRGGGNPYRDRSKMLNSYYLSSAAYPWATDSTDFVNNSLTDTSLPASEMYTQNASGSHLLSKPITAIVRHADGTISFTFHASNTPDGIKAAERIPSKDEAIYDLQGRRIAATSSLPAGFYIINGKKVIKTWKNR